MQGWPQRFLLANRVAVAQVLSECYPLTPALLANEWRLWDWGRVAGNAAICWDRGLLEQFGERLPGHELAGNVALPWSATLAQAGVDEGRWTWRRLTHQPRVFEDPELLALCLPHWGTWLSHARSVEWGAGAEQWAPSLLLATPNLDWSALSCLEHFPWSLEFLHAHAERLDWARLSTNPGLPWSRELLVTFAQRWDWGALSACEGVPWTPELIEAFAPRLRWEALLNHPRVRWTLASFERFAPHAEAALGPGWLRACKTENWSAELVLARLAADPQALSFEHLCRFAAGVWTPARLEYYSDRLGREELRALASNAHLRWGEPGLLERWAPLFGRGCWYALSCNLGFEATREQLQAYAGDWDWDEQSSRHSVVAALAWPELPWHWAQVIHADRVGLCASLELGEVEAFVAARLRTRVEPRATALEAAIAREFEEDAPFEVYADWLEGQGDPHAALIRAMLGRGEESEDAAPEATHDAVMRYVDHVELDLDDTRWSRGFVLATKLWRDWRGLLGLRALRFVEELEIFAGPQSPVTAAAMQELGQLCRLHCLALRHVEQAALAEVGALAGVRRLALCESQINSVEPLRALPLLEELYLADLPLTQLDGLAHLPALRSLRLASLPLQTLDSLARLQGLEHISLAELELEDSLFALLGLGKLRSLVLSNIELSEDTLERFRRARPEVELNHGEQPRVRDAGSLSLWQG